MAIIKNPVVVVTNTSDFTHWENFREVEWVGSDGSQLLNTGVVPSATTGISLSLKDLVFYNNDFYFFGCRIENGNTFAIGNYNGKYDYARSSWKTTNFTINTQNKQTIKLNYLNDGKFWCDEQSVQLEGSFGSVGIPICAFGQYRYNSANNMISFCYIYKICELRISDGQEVIRNYKPCYHKESGIIGLFDLVNNTFLCSYGLTKGADVT